MGYTLLRLLAGGNWNNGVIAAALSTVTITPGMSTLTLARASAVTYELFRLSKLWLTSKDYLHIVRTYSPSWDYQANIKKDASG